MSAFTGELTITQIDQDWRLWRLESDLVYEIGELGSGRTIVVPAVQDVINGVEIPFITDGTSVPRILWGLLPTWGKYSRAAVVHDYLGYLLGKAEMGKGEAHPEAPDQRTADGIFLEAMGVLEVAWPVRMALWVAVRLADRFPFLRQLGVRSANEVVGAP